jgi:sortase A
MQQTRLAASGGCGFRFLRWVERLLLIGGAAALVWYAWIGANAYLVQRLAREMLESVPPGTSTASPTVALGTPLAELSIPRVGLSAVVLEGSDDNTLRVGVGHIETTPLPGDVGNVAIAGHRDSFFRSLENVHVGDDILLDTPKGSVHYRVSWFRVVNPDEVGVIGPTTYAMLTLVTCYPFRFIGPAPDRFVVRAIRVEDPPAVGPATPDRRAP